MLSTSDIERQLEHCHFKPVKNADRVHGDFARVPMFMVAFDDFLKKYNRIPDYDEFEKHYFSINAEHFKQHPRNLQFAKERCNRAYPSLIRDVHFTSLLKESGLQNEYDLKTDVYGGVDQVVKYRGQEFYVHCFVDSKLGRASRQSKDLYHQVNNHHLDLAINVHSPECKTVGNISLYSEKHIGKLINMMDNLVGA